MGKNMADHSSLSLIVKLVRIISFLLLWQFGCGFRATSIAQVRHPAGASQSTGFTGNPDPPNYCNLNGNQRWPCEEMKALRNVLDALGSPLASSISISLKYCNTTRLRSIKCHCYGTVICHITEIRLESQYLSGYIHKDAGFLQSLELLYLSNNKLYGTIPDSLGTLSNLTRLRLAGNQLTGKIPVSLGNLMNLIWLDLSYNQLSDQIPGSLGNLSTNLTSLDLRNNQLTEPIPEELKNLGKLTTLYLNENFLTGKIPSSLSELSYLRILDLGYNKLDGRIPSKLGELKNLTELRLDENLLDGPLPLLLGELISLQTLSLTSNKLTGKLPQQFEKLTNLLTFRVYGNSLSGEIPSYITTWVNLSRLNLLGNNFEGPLPNEIFSMEKLQYLWVSDLNNRGGFPFPDDANLAIKSLILRNCSVTGEIPSDMGESWTSLSYLDLSFNKLTGGIPESLHGLDEIYLTGNMLSGVVPGWIKAKKRFKVDLSYNNFELPEAKKNTNLALDSDVTSQKINMNSILQVSTDLCKDGKSKYHSLFINSGDEEANINGTHYEADENLSSFNVSKKKNWAYTCSGDFLALSSNSSNYIQNASCGVSIRDEALYKKARLCPVALTYYGFCLQKGSYTVKLHFAEILYTENADYSILGKRVFDVYVQGKRVLTEFNIKDNIGPNKEWVENITTEVEKKHKHTLTIKFYWAGKGSIYNPPQLNGPLISAISVTPNFKVGGLSTGQISGITTASVLAPLLILTLLWRVWLVRDRELRESKVHIQGKVYTVKQIIDATRNFSPKNEIDNDKGSSIKKNDEGSSIEKNDKGSFGRMFKAELPDDQVVAVKKLCPKSMQQHGGQIQSEIANLKSLPQNDNVVQLLDGYSKKDLHLLIYQYMEHGSLEKVLFGNLRSQFINVELLN